MTAPLAFRRDAADVQAMRLDSVAAMFNGRDWLWDHGVIAATNGDCLAIRAIDGSRMVARLGDWLTYDGEVFAVEADDGGKPSGHTKVEGEG